MIIRRSNVVDYWNQDDSGKPLMHSAVSGESSSGAIPVHIKEGETETLVYVSPYHYYRVGMESVELSPATGDDSPVVPEAGFDGVCKVGEPRMISDSAFSLDVTASGIGNWILTLTTTAKAYSTKGRQYARRSRTVQFRISTKKPLDDYVNDL